MKLRYFLIAPLIAFLSLACGGSSRNTPAPSPATGLTYTNPVAADGEWRLVQDATTSSKHLVLNLVGPNDGSKYRGVGFTLQTDPSLVKFSQFLDANGQPLSYFTSGGIFQDKSSSGLDVPPILQVGGVTKEKLMVGIFQKTDDEVFGPVKGSTAKNCYAVILQVAIDLDPTLEALPGNVPLSVLKARVIPEHIDTLFNRKTEDITLRIGTLKLH